MQVASLDLWGEPLENGIQRVLALNLTGMLNTQNVSFFPWHPERAPDFGVEVNLLQLDANEHEALLVAEWLVYRPARPESARRRITRLQVPLPAGAPQPEQVAAAYSTLLFQLSETIAAAIERGAGCGQQHRRALMRTGAILPRLRNRWDAASRRNRRPRKTPSRTDTSPRRPT